MTDLQAKIKALIRRIPRGKVATYGQIATLAGNPRAARQTALVLASSSRREKLPWQRVVNSQGRISLPPGRPYERQKELLEKEGVRLDEKGRINLERHQWRPARGKLFR